MVSNWELGSSAKQLEPRREQVSGYPIVTRVTTDENSKSCHLTVELTTSPPRKRDIATNVPDVKSAPATPTLLSTPSHIVTFIKASNDKNGNMSLAGSDAMVTSV